MKPEIQILAWVDMPDPSNKGHRIVGMRIRSPEISDFHTPMDQLRIAYDSHTDLLEACQVALLAATEHFSGDIAAEAKRVRGILRQAIAKATQS